MAFIVMLCPPWAYPGGGVNENVSPVPVPVPCSVYEPLALREEIIKICFSAKVWADSERTRFGIYFTYNSLNSFKLLQDAAEKWTWYWL